MAEIANRIYETSEGQILFISDFSDINDNEKVVSRALSVEEKKGNIVRLANGVYLRPKNTRFGIVYPSIDEMVMAIAQRDKVQIQPSGVTALNKLGLSTQVPTKYTYLTSGSGRVLTLGNRTIELKRSVPKNFAFQTVLAALLVQALRTLGQKMNHLLALPLIRITFSNLASFRSEFKHILLAQINDRRTGKAVLRHICNNLTSERLGSPGNLSELSCL